MSDGDARKRGKESKRYELQSYEALRATVKQLLGKDALRPPEARRLSLSREGRLIRAVHNTAGRCSMPILRYYRSYTSFDEGRAPAVAAERDSSYVLQRMLRCRVCEWCRKVRKNEWANRALVEYERSARTWLCTYTANPESHWLFDQAVALKHRRLGGTPPGYNDDALFRDRAAVMGNELQLYFKRLRKAGRVLRYLLVAEAHTGERRPGRPYFDRESTSGVLGRPHFHALVHEVVAGDFIHPDEVYVTSHGEDRGDDASLVKKEWAFGYSQMKACGGAREAYYLCSYLEPSTSWRVHASQRYGELANGRPAATTEERPVEFEVEDFDLFSPTGGGVSSPPSGDGVVPPSSYTRAPPRACGTHVLAAVVPAAVGTGPGRSAAGPRDPARIDDGPRDPSIETLKSIPLGT